MSSYLESLHKLWVERCRIIYERLASNEQAEDHQHLLQHARVLFQKADIDAPNILYQYKYRSYRLSIETLREIACQLLSDLGVDDTTTPFYNDVDRQYKRAWRSLTLEIVQQRDQATIQRHQQMKKNK